MPAAAAAAKSLQSCPTLYDPIDSSPPGSTIPGILPHESWWLPLYQALSLCPQPWVLAHVIPSDGSPVLQEPQGLGSMAGGRWQPTGPPTQQGTAGICAHTLILAQSGREFKLSVQCLWLGGSAERSQAGIGWSGRQWGGRRGGGAGGRRVRVFRKGGACFPVGNQRGPFSDVPPHQKFPMMRMSQASMLD